MRVVILGGAGFVGLNVAEQLLARGDDVVLFDIGPPPDAALAHFESLPGDAAPIVGDSREPDTLAPTFADPVDAVVFGAAITSSGDREKDTPEAVVAVNLGGFINALRAAQSAGARRFINLSSSAAYGRAAFGAAPLTEDTPADPATLYAMTKFGAERAGERLGALWEMDVRSVRLSGVYGRWERQTSARDTPSPQHQIMRAALDGRPALLARPAARDWLYAADAAKAIIGLIDAESLAHPLYNISGGAPVSALAFGQTLAARWPALVAEGFVCRLAAEGEPPTIGLHDIRDRQPMVCDRLAAEIGFAPNRSVEEAVDDYARWISTNQGAA